MGTGTSPILYDNLVIVQCDEENGDGVVHRRLDKKTGKEVWKTPRKVQISWSTPLLVRTSTARGARSRAERKTSFAYDPATGKELWTHKGVESNAIPSPVANSEMVIVSSRAFRQRSMIAIRSGQTAI